MRAIASGLLLLGIVTAAKPSLAQPRPISRGDARSSSVLAESLFAEGKLLMAAGQTQAACAKFEGSWKLDPKATGVLLNLALCNEKARKLATAWGQFRDVAARSRAARPDRLKLAEQHVTRLEPRLSKVFVYVPDAAKAAGLVVTLDGVRVEEAAWETDLPVDGGAHVVEATAPGKVDRRLEASVKDEGDRTTFEVPALADAPRPEPPPPAASAASEPPPASASSSHRDLGIGLTVAGAAVLGAGIGFGIAAVAAKGGIGAACPAPCVEGSAAAAESDRAYSRANAYAWVADVAMPVGVVAAAAGVFVLVTSGKPAPSTSRARPRLEPAPVALGHGAVLQLSQPW